MEIVRQMKEILLMLFALQFSSFPLFSQESEENYIPETDPPH
jgi:hypothetical protein